MIHLVFYGDRFTCINPHADVDDDLEILSDYRIVRNLETITHIGSFITQNLCTENKNLVSLLNKFTFSSSTALQLYFLFKPINDETIYKSQKS